MSARLEMPLARFQGLSAAIERIVRQTLVLSENDLRTVLAVAEQTGDDFIIEYTKAILGFRMHLGKLRNLPAATSSGDSAG